MTQLAFGEWLPDQPELANPGAIEAKNCIAETANSYRSLKALQSFTDALSAACIGSAWARARDGSIYNFAGDAATLYRLTANTWDDVSKFAGYAASNWDFAQYGERIIVTDIGTAPQYYDMGTSALFDDLPGSPPNASFVSVVRDFVVFGDVDDGVHRPSRLHWSGFNNSEQWPPSAATQAGRQDLKGRGGPIRKIIGGDIGAIFQERSISRMSYVGPPVKFRIDEMETARGTSAPNSAVVSGSRAYYYAPDGFFMLDLRGGAESKPIGALKVNTWFKANSSATDRIDMRAAVDSENSLVIWAFKTTTGLAYFDHVLIYNWQANRWTHAEVSIQAFSEFAQVGLTLDELAVLFPGGIDAESIPVDSSAYAGGDIGLMVFNSSNQACTFSGDPLSITLDTKEFTKDGAMTFINSVRPLVESNGPLSITPVLRDILSENSIVGSPSVANDIGTCDMRANARYHRYRLTGDSLIKHASGVEFKTVKKGRR